MAVPIKVTDNLFINLFLIKTINFSFLTIFTRYCLGILKNVLRIELGLGSGPTVADTTWNWTRNIEVEVGPGPGPTVAQQQTESKRL